MNTISRSVNNTVKLGSRLGRLLGPGDVVGLTGELGSGKTTFTKGIAGGLGIRDAKHVNSPSFVIVKEYAGRVPLYHFDIYRLDDPSDLDTVGYKEYFYGRGVTVIEWADKIGRILPDEYLAVEFSAGGERERTIKFTPRGQRYEKLCARMR